MHGRNRRLLRTTLSTLFAAALLSPWQPVLAQFREVGNMLVSRCDGLGGGGSVALSGDGTTAFVGVAGDLPPWYFALVYNITPVGWSQLGCGLATGSPEAGAVAVTPDGNTVAVSAATIQAGPNAYFLGSVFTRSGGTLSQQAGLIGSNVVGGPFGSTVAISADGNTAIAGVALDGSLTGAAWVFTRSGGVWSQQGPKLVGTDAVGPAEQGWSVALSADGNTAIVAGGNDNNGVGAAWVFTRSTECGRSRPSWWAAAQLETPTKARSPFRPTATPPSWVGATTTLAQERCGSSRAAAASGRSRAAS